MASETTQPEDPAPVVDVSDMPDVTLEQPEAAALDQLKGKPVVLYNPTGLPVAVIGAGVAAPGESVEVPADHPDLKWLKATGALTTTKPTQEA